MLGEGNHSHCLVTQNRRDLEEAHAGTLLSARIFFLYSGLFAVCALYLKCIVWFPTHCTFHGIYLFIPLYVHVHDMQSINLVCSPYILSLQIIIDSKKIAKFFSLKPRNSFKNTWSHSPTNKKIFLQNLYGSWLKVKQSNWKFVHAYQEPKRYILSHTYTPTYADTSK